jgi:hypothetical protein
MRIKKKHIKENTEKASQIAKKNAADINKLAGEIEQTVGGDEELANDIAFDAYKAAYDEGGLTEVGDKSVHTSKWDKCFNKIKQDKSEESAAAICTDSIGYEGSIKKSHQRQDEGEYDSEGRKIQYGVEEPKDFENDGDGQRGGPDYGQEEPKKKSKSIRGADYNDKDLPFESVNEGTDFSIIELEEHIINLNNQIASTDDPKQLAFLKKWKEDTMVKLKEKVNAGKTNESVKPKMSKNQLIETVLGKKERQVIKTFKVKDLRNE